MQGEWLWDRAGRTRGSAAAGGKGDRPIESGDEVEFVGGGLPGGNGVGHAWAGDVWSNRDRLGFRDARKLDGCRRAGSVVGDHNLSELRAGRGRSERDAQSTGLIWSVAGSGAVVGELEFGRVEAGEFDARDGEGCAVGAGVGDGDVLLECGGVDSG